MRKPFSYFRGSCYGYPGSSSRVELAGMKHPLLDVGLTSACFVGSWKRAPMDWQMRLQSTRKPRRAPFKRHGEYKYLVHMPGAAHGSYSRHLQFALGMGAVVLKWEIGRAACRERVCKYV